MSIPKLDAILNFEAILTIKDEYGGLVGETTNPPGNYGDEIVIGGIDFVAKSANAEITELPFDEHIHIVPIEVGNTKLVGNVFWDYDLDLGEMLEEPKDKAKTVCYNHAKHVDFILKNYIFPSLPKSENDIRNYQLSMYSGSKRIYKLFLKTSVLKDTQLKNNDIFNPYDSTMRYPKTVKPQAQEDTSQKQNILYGGKDTIYKTVTKIMYMLKYGLKAKGVYNNKTDAEGSIIKEGGKKFGVGTDNYKNLMGRSVRFLWAECQYKQLHRGVDFYYKEGDPVYAICGGTVSKCDNNYSIYISTSGYGPDKKEITVIYCHCNKDTNIKKDDPIYPGQLIGTVGRNAYDEYGETPPHVHIEIDPGNHAVGNNKDISVHDIASNLLRFTVGKTALNPYAYFRSMWSKFPDKSAN